MKFSSVILAGGKSSRMGHDKASLPFESRSLLARQVELLRKLGPVELFLSSGTNVYPHSNCLPLRDNFVGCGPLAGIEAALSLTSAPLLLVLAVDLPRMSHETLSWLLQQCDENSGVIPRIDGNIEPLVAVYPKAAHPWLHEALTARRKAAQDFARACISQARARWADVPAEHQGSFVNCNTPEEWAAMTKHA